MIPPRPSSSGSSGTTTHGIASGDSIAILLGGLGAVIPTRRHDIARLGLKAVIAGMLVIRANHVDGQLVGARAEEGALDADPVAEVEQFPCGPVVLGDPLSVEVSLDAALDIADRFRPLR